MIFADNINLIASIFPNTSKQSKIIIIVVYSQRRHYFLGERVTRGKKYDREEESRCPMCLSSSKITVLMVEI